MAASGAWSAAALADDPTLSKHSRYVEDSGERCWTINAAIAEAVPADVLSAMRRAFGGHVEPKK